MFKMTTISLSTHAGSFVMAGVSLASAEDGPAQLQLATEQCNALLIL
jgi:hypothetical protein